MEKLESFLALFKKPTETTCGVMFFVALFLTFAPAKILAKLSLVDFASDNKVAISLSLLISFAYFLKIIIKSSFEYAKSEFETYQLRKINVEYLLALSSENKKTVIDMYNGNRTEYFEINDANTGVLVAYNIIGQASQFSKHMTTFGYFLQPWVIEYLDKNYNKFAKEVKK